MPNDLVFRKREEVVEEVETKVEERETPNLIEGREDGAAKDPDAIDEVERLSPLEEWELENGKYGLEFFNIKEIANEFPLKAQFGVVDNYVKAEMKRLGYDTPGRYQQILDGLEAEVGSRKLNPYERVKKLADYVKIVKKLADLEEKKRLFR